MFPFLYSPDPTRTGGGLVKEEDGGCRDERARNVQPPLLAARQPAHQDATRQRPTHLIHPTRSEIQPRCRLHRALSLHQLAQQYSWQSSESALLLHLLAIIACKSVLKLVGTSKGRQKTSHGNCRSHAQIFPLPWPMHVQPHTAATKGTPCNLCMVGPNLWQCPRDEGRSLACVSRDRHSPMIFSTSSMRVRRSSGETAFGSVRVAVNLRVSHALMVGTKQSSCATYALLRLNCTPSGRPFICTCAHVPASRQRMPVFHFLPRWESPG